MSWQDSINQMVARLGIPSWLNSAVTTVESGNNPSAIGDQGSSFGLYQLHVGGQAPSGVPTAQLLNPVTNAQYALPAVARGYHAAGPFSDTFSWWQQFAVASGHPGGAPGNAATVAEAQKLQAAYHQSGNVSPFTAVTGSTPREAGASSTGVAGLATFMDQTGAEVLFAIVGLTVVVVAIGIMKGK